MPERQEWDTDVGWCGEASIQTIALYYGAWISQFVVRTVNGHPVVFGDGTSEQVLAALHFNYAVWDFASANDPEYQAFMIWMKGYLVQGMPTILSEYVSDHGTPADPDYDHLVPAYGVKTAAADSMVYDPNDILYFNTNEGQSVSRAFSKLSGSRSCSVPSTSGGCIPDVVDYGAAITGIMDPGHVTFPVHVAVSGDHEPNPTSGQTPVEMSATVAVGGLTAGRQYTLLRYNDYTKVPNSGAAADFLSSAADLKIPFTATSSSYSYVDPQKFLSNTAVFYRCVAN